MVAALASGLYAYADLRTRAARRRLELEGEARSVGLAVRAGLEAAGPKAIQAAPYDERIHVSLNVAANDALGKRGVIVVSHVDVPPPRKDECIAALNPLAEASRKAAGNQRYEVQQQSSRPNHSTVAETSIETSRSAATSHLTKIAWPPARSIIFTVSEAPASSISETTTRAPSAAKANALARPIPHELKHSVHEIDVETSKVRRLTLR